MSVGYEVDGPVGTITIDRPERRNALDRAHVQDLLAAVAEASADGAVRSVVVIGAGDTFCAGTDMSEPDEIDPAHDDWWAAMEPHGWWWPIVAAPKPFVAAVDGVAVGMGVELATHCDWRVATTRARFWWNFVHRGLVPDTGAGTWLLPRQVGLANAVRLVLDGRPLPAEEAQAMGYVHDVVDPESLASAAREVAERLATGSPMALRLAKRLLYDGLDRSVAEHLPAHVEAIRTCFASRDHAEGVAAFFDKRDPTFTGE